MKDPDHLGEHARRMRREPTEYEKRLRRHISNSQLGGYKFRRQSPLPPYVADFFCPAKALIVEVDGETHCREVDARRDASLAQRGFTTIRFTNDEVRDHMDAVLSTILETLKSLPDRWDRSCAGPGSRPHPNPSPEGEGL